MNGKRCKIIFLLLSKFLTHGEFPLALCVHIYNKSNPFVCGKGTSSYARRRRAASIGRCVRCYRVSPPLNPTYSRCDGVRCVPGISYNLKVENYIRWGVTEVIPHPGYNF